MPSARIVLLVLVLVAGWWSASPDAARQADHARHPIVDATSLTGKLLVATPDLRHPTFRETVIYLVKHDDGGAMGLVVNRLLASGPLDQLLEGFGIEVEGASDEEVQLFHGGPVGRGQGFVLHSPDYQDDGTLAISAFAALSGSVEVLRAIATGAGPRQRFLAFGYAGWAPNQLESEIARGSWYVVAADATLVFDQQVDDKWQRALDRREVDL